MKKDNQNLWFDINKILSYKALISVVVGQRGGGKTYSTKKRCIIDFMEKGFQFVWARRYDTELSQAKKTFFDKIRSDAEIMRKYPDIKLHTFGNNIYINEKVAGTFLPLSLASQFKGTDYPFVKNLILDEFIIETGNSHYLNNEVYILENLIETIQRERDDIRVILLGNSISFNNPYFIKWRIKPFKSEFLHLKDRSIVIQMYYNETFAKMKEDSRLGKLTKGTQFFNMAIKNEFMDTDDKFIKKKPEYSKYRCTLRYEGNEYGFWWDSENGELFVNRNVDPSCPYKYTLSQKDHDVNYMLVKNYKGTHLKEIVECYQYSCLYFSDISVRYQISEMMLYFVK